MTKNKSILVLFSLVATLMASIVLNRRPLGISDRQRVMTWQTALKAIKTHPSALWLGFGPESFDNTFRLNKPSEWTDYFGTDIADDAHNDFLQVLVTCGVLGVISYLFFLLKIARSLDGPKLGAMAALFLCIKLNPISIEMLVLAAIITSCGNKIILPTWARAAFVGIAFVIFGIAGRLSLADYYAKKGDFFSLRKACELNPYEMNYKNEFINRGIMEINKTHSIILRTELLKAMRFEAQSALVHRTYSPSAWFLAGTEAKAEKQLGVFRKPHVFFRRAIALDPYNPPLLRMAQGA